MIVVTEKFIIKPRDLDSLINKLHTLKDEQKKLSQKFINYLKSEFLIYKLVNQLDNI
tara:strand:- start:622 stop:792 length:171 start_codon:yes stop_codon:yes gene_type:complete